MISREDRLRADDGVIRQALRDEGEAIGQAKGEAKVIGEVIRKLMAKGFDTNAIAEMLDLPLAQVAGISKA